MYSSLIPYAAFTSFTPALPEFYWNVYSAEQRIKHICYELCKMHAYSDYLAERIDELGEDLENELDAIRKEIDEWEKGLKNELLRLISELEKGQLQWDVQLGKYTDTIEAQRDMFNDVTVHSYNVEQLETLFDVLDMDVDGLANCGLNVKGFAVVNHFLLRPDGPTSDVIADRENAKEILTVNDLGETLLDAEGYLYVTPKNGRS